MYKVGLGLGSCTCIRSCEGYVDVHVLDRVTLLSCTCIR